MAAVTAIDELLSRRNDLDITPAVGQDTSVAAPASQVAILTCMDARIQVPALFDLAPGQAHILRNGGGVVTDDMIRSLALSQRELGTREVMIIGHTSCGMSTITDDSFKDDLETATGLRPTWAVEAFRDVEAAVRQSVQRAKRSPFLAHTDQVRGFVYDVHTGTLTEV